MQDALKDVFGPLFKAFEKRWSTYSGAVDVWKRNFSHLIMALPFANINDKIKMYKNVQIKMYKK